MQILIITKSSNKAQLLTFAYINQYIHQSSHHQLDSLLVANGGYNFHDAQLIAQNLISTNNNFTNYGYSYPDWYSTSVIESPAKIAQQLLKNLRSQRLEEPVAGADVPKFVGFGRAEVSDGLEARLTCSFDEPIDRTNVSI